MVGDYVTPGICSGLVSQVQTVGVRVSVSLADIKNEESAYLIRW